MKTTDNLLRIRSGVGWMIAGALLFCSPGAFAYQQVTVTEGQSAKFRVKLPTFPHEARQHSSGYKSVKYHICSSDGTATGGVSSTFFGADYPAGTDYRTFCPPMGLKITFTSTSNYSKYLDLSWPTVDDDDKKE